MEYPPVMVKTALRRSAVTCSLISDDIILSRSAGDAFLIKRESMTRSLVLFQASVSLRPLMARNSSMPAVRNCSGVWCVLSPIWLRQIDLLSRPKDSALPGLYIGRYSPQPQSHVERIDPERGPEGKLTNPMLFRMAGGAQWNGVAIARLHPYTTIGRCTHMRSV